MSDEWTELANFIADMIAKYASEIDIDKLELPPELEKPEREESSEKINQEISQTGVDKHDPA